MWLITLDIKLAEKTREGWVDGREGGRKDGRKERGGVGEEQKGSFKTAETSSLHSPLLLHEKKSCDYLLENTDQFFPHWLCKSVLYQTPIL